MTNAQYPTTSSLPGILAWGGLGLVTAMSSLPAAPDLPDERPIVYRAYHYAPPNIVSTSLAPFIGDPVVDHYRPRTDLGRKLIALRRAYVIGGGRLLRGEEIDEEMRSRRGGTVDA